MREKTIYALGFFDGVHIGHQALLRACKELAQTHGCASGVMTFDCHPNVVVNRSTMPLLYSGARRNDLLMDHDIERIIMLKFDDKLMCRLWRDYLEMLIEQFGAAGFVCGDDFRFGYKGEGDAAKLQEFCAEKGLPCAVVPEQTVGGRRVSSSAIRLALAQGDIDTVTAFLGRNHTIGGTVCMGRGIGRTIGVPTANFKPEPDILLPCRGVYATVVICDGERYYALTNIGSRPTVSGHNLRIESFLLDYDDNLYGSDLLVELHAYLRPEIKFDSLDALKVQIDLDIQKARAIFQIKE